MNVLLIYRVNIAEKAHSGVLLKMASQQKALKALGHEVSLVNHDAEHIFLNQQILASQSITSKLGRYWYNYKLFFKALKTKLEFSKYDLIYIRYPFSNPSFLAFCREAKLKKPKLKIIVEMPTFPYNQEFEGLSKVYPLIDNHYRKGLVKDVDRIVHFGEEESLFDIETIRVTNGIDFDSYPSHLRKRVPGKIVCMAIAKWFFWHGLDRVLEGMAAYQNSEYEIELLVVGEGKESGNLKSLSDRLKLSNQVSFLGIKNGEELDKIFDQVDIGIGTLGIHRKGLTYNASLKHREFCARGIPFILSTTDSAFPEECNFVHYCDANDDAIGMETIINLYERNLKWEEIRNYGREKFDWRQIMKKILKEL